MMIEKAELKEIIVYLENKPVIVCDPYPQYNELIYRLLGSLGYDVDYLDKYEEVGNKDIELMDLVDLRVFFTYIVRGERFSEGFIMEYLNNGMLLKLAKREWELL